MESFKIAETIASILKSKGSVIHSVRPDTTVYEAVAMMAANGTSAVLVVEQANLLGILSAKDYGTRVLLQGKNGKDLLAREVMTSPVVTVGANVRVADAMQIMTTKKIRHLPILEDGKLVGVVTLADLVRAVLANQEFHIDQLMRYVGHK